MKRFTVIEEFGTVGGVGDNFESVVSDYYEFQPNDDTDIIVVDSKKGQFCHIESSERDDLSAVEWIPLGIE